jgi:L-fuculose-phosphate aldolase
MTMGREREDVAAACRRLADAGLVIGSAGNVSVRSGEGVAITPTGCRFAELAPEEVTVVDLDGRVTDGALAPTSEIALHLGVYRAIEHAGAVVHTHAPMATALSCVVDEVPPIHYQMLQLGGSIPVAPYATFGTEELAAEVVAALSDRTAALMRNHGAVAYGLDLDGAVDGAELVEWACALYWRARMLGEPSVLSREQLEDVVAVATRRRYGSTRPAEAE